jgi:hypothetical protein
MWETGGEQDMMPQAGQMISSSFPSSSSSRSYKSTRRSPPNMHASPREAVIHIIHTQSKNLSPFTRTKERDNSIHNISAYQSKPELCVFCKSENYTTDSQWRHCIRERNCPYFTILQTNGQHSSLSTTNPEPNLSPFLQVPGLTKLCGKEQIAEAKE